MSTTGPPEKAVKTQKENCRTQARGRSRPAGPGCARPRTAAGTGQWGQVRDMSGGEGQGKAGKVM